MICFQLVHRPSVGPPTFFRFFNYFDQALLCFISQYLHLVKLPSLAPLTFLAPTIFLSWVHLPGLRPLSFIRPSNSFRSIYLHEVHSVSFGQCIFFTSTNFCRSTFFHSSACIKSTFLLIPLGPLLSRSPFNCITSACILSSQVLLPCISTHCVFFQAI